MKRTLSLLLTLLMLVTSLPLNALVALADELTAVSVESISENTADQVALLKDEDGKGSNGKIVYNQQELIKGYCTANGTPVASTVHSYFTMDAAGIETITITPPDAPEWNPLNIYYIVIVEKDGTVSCYGKLDQQEPTVIELGGKVKGTVYFNAFYDDHPEYVYVKEAIVVPHEHDYQAAIIPPTCTDKGYTAYTCEGCGESYVSDEAEAVGHSYTNGVCIGCGIKDYRAVTYVAFGDSITYGVDGNYQGNVPGRVMSDPYPQLVGTRLNFGTVINKAVSGGTLCADSGRTNMTERILSFNGDADVISVMLGVNDYQMRCPMGDLDSTDNKTIYGSLNLICRHLTQNYPDAFVFFMTPFQYRGGENDRGAGYNLPAVAEAIKEVAAKYQLPVLDMYTYGRYEEEFNNPSLAYQDGIHPSQQHHIKYTAPMIAKFVAANYNGPKMDEPEDGNGKIVYKRQELIKGYCTASGTPVASNVHSYFTMDAAGIETITITPPDAPAWNHLNIYYIVIVEEDGTVSCYGKLDQQEPTVIELGGKVKGAVYFNAFYDDHPEYVYVKEAIVVPHEHDYQATIISPTCTDKGYTTYTCACGDSYVGDYVDSVGHAWGEWKDVALGKEERSCNACGETEIRDKIPDYDVDGNGTVDHADVTLLMSVLVGNTETDALFDFDFDGELTIYDCVLLMQQIN